MSGIANWQAQIRIDIEDLKKRIKVAEGEINNFTNEDRKVKLDIDTKTLESAIQKLDKMLDSLGKGTGDFKQFENLSKELSSIVSEVQSLSKAFGKVDDSGAKTLLSSIQNIDKSLSELSQNILNVNKNMNNMGGNTSGAVKQAENISNAYQDAAKEAEKLADAQSKIGQKTNISSASTPLINDQNNYQKELSETKKLTDDNVSSMFEFIKLCQEQAKALGETNEELKERAAYFKDEKISGGVSVGTHYAGNHDNSDINGANSDLHSHFSKYASFSENDLFNLKDTIKNFMVMGTDELTHFDTSGLSKDLLEQIWLRYDAAIKELNQQYFDNLNIKNNLKFTDIDDIPERILDKAFEFAENQSNIDYDYDKYDVFYNNQIEKIRQKLLEGASLNDITNSISDDIKSFDINGVESEIKTFQEKFTESIRGYLTNILLENDVFNPDKLLGMQDYNIARNNSLKSVLDELNVGSDRLKTIDISNLEKGYSSLLKILGLVVDKQKEVASTDSTDQRKDAFQGADATASVEKTTQAIREENNALEETANKAKQAVSELVKSRDVVSQNWYREKGTVVGKDSKGNDITRDADEFSFVERLKNGQLQTVLATYNEETGKWAEQIINVRTAFEQVEKAIISADNKIASLEMTKEKTLAAHPGYDTTADDNQIAIERKKRDELQNTLNLYGQEKEYVFEIEATNKRIADNQERLNNKKQSQTNLRQAVSNEQFLKELNEAWNSAIKVNNALNETNSLLNSLKIPNGFEGSFSTLESEIKRLNSEFGSGKISATEYANDIKKAFSNYQTPIDNRSKDTWNDLTISLDRYATLQKRIASNNALSTDNEEAIKLLEHIHELQRNDILPTEKLTASNEKLKQINQTVTDLKAKLKESTLDSLQGSIDKYQKIYNQRSTYSSDFAPSEQYVENLNELNTAIGKLEKYKNTLKDVGEVTVEQEAELKRLVAACEKASDSFKSLSASEKGASQIAVDKLVQRINKDLDECTNYSENAKNKLRALREELESANPRNLKEITSEIINIENAEIRAGRAGRTLWDTMKNSGFHQIAAQIAGMVGVYDVINAGKEGINVVRELNTALTEMQKVSDETKQKLKDYQSTTFNTADAVGTTAKQIQNSTADWMRLGESMNQAAESAKDANILLNVSEFNNIDEATESLVSMSQAYKDLDKMDIIDVLNNVGNNYSISTDGLATALQDSASALVTANNDLNEAVALTTAGNAIPQDPSSVGAGMRTISLRLVGTKAAKEELESLGEDTSDVITTTSKLRETILDATKDASADGKGFDILDDNGNYKSTYEIMQGLADLYDDIVKKDKELGTNNLNLLLETIAGEFLPEICGNTFYRTHLIALIA